MPSPQGLILRLRSLLPHAELTLQSPPHVPEIALWLFADLHPEEPLDGAVVNALMEEPPYWSLCWASGQVLARYLLDHPERMRGRTVVDLGAGSGVVAIAAALAGAKWVIACDLDPWARQAVEENARANGVVLETSAALEDCLGQADLVTAADILYDRDNLSLLPRLAESAQVLLADSRIPGLDPAGYRRLGVDHATTWPDLDESGEFNRVRLFATGAGWPKPGSANVVEVSHPNQTVERTGVVDPS